MTLTFAPAGCTELLLHKYLDLFSICFPKTADFSLAYLKWLYDENPDGKVVGFDAWNGTELAATYVCVPATVRLDGLEVRALLSLNTATHPKFQGQGLFTKLANQTYELAKATGHELVFGVANQNSIGGFSRKLGFTDVCALDVRVGLGSPIKLDLKSAEAQAQFQRRWTQETLHWRLRNPKLPLRAKASGGATRIVGATGYPAMTIQTEVSVDIAATEPPQFGMFQLHLGKEPAGTSRARAALPIPERLKPSPLRFIYRNLERPGETVDPHRLLFRFIDFDAY
jgi:GNAT superfamily N-acetyltransferase